MKLLPLLLSALAIDTIDASWVTTCAQEGLVGSSSQDQPIRGSLSDALLTCMVDHATTSRYVTDQLIFFPIGDDWCLPKDFLSDEQTCGSLLFDIFEPLRHCIQEEGFPELSSDPRYRSGFEDSSNSDGESTFYLSSRLSLAMCELLDALRTTGGIECLQDFCQNASVSPSAEPSQTPSSTPSMSPSTAPSQSPTLEPSSEPSWIPSDVPSIVPSTQPTISLQPSTVDTESPSTEPSLDISSGPSSTPVNVYDSGTWLRTKTTLRIFLDGVGQVPLPLSETVDSVLVAAFEDILRSIPGFQRVELASASRAPVPENSPLVVSTRIIVIRSCDIIDCIDPFSANDVGSECRDVFEEAVADGSLRDAIQQSAEVEDTVALLNATPRENSSNLMSVSSYLINDESGEDTAPVKSGVLKKHHACLLSILFSLLLVV